MTTLITAGGAILLCLGVGGVIGGVYSSPTRAEHRARGLSDAGGMLRLELEEWNSPSARRSMGGARTEVIVGRVAEINKAP